MSETRTAEVEREHATPEVLPGGKRSTNWRRFGAPRAAQPQVALLVLCAAGAEAQAR